MFKNIKKGLWKKTNNLSVAQDLIATESSSTLVPYSSSDNCSIADVAGLLSDENSLQKEVDLIATESSSTLVLHSSSDNCSIADVAGLLSDENSPQKEVDLIVTESSSILVPHSNSDNCSIADVAGLLSDENSPQKEVDLIVTESSSILVPPSNSDNCSIADVAGLLSDENSPQKEVEEALQLKITLIETELTELHKQKEDLEKLNQLKCTKEDLLGKVAKEKSQHLSLQQELEKKTWKVEDIELKEHLEEHLDEEYGEERLFDISKELGSAQVKYKKQMENFYNEISGLKKEKALEIATRKHLEQELLTLQRSRDSEIVELTKAVKQLNDEKEQFRMQAKEKYEACESQCKPVIKQLNAKIQQLQDQSGELEAVKAEILKTTTEFDASRTDYEKQVNDFHNKIFELKNEIKHLENNNSENISKLKQKQVELIFQLELKDEEYQAILTEKGKAHDAEIAIINGNIKQLTQEIQQLKIEENERFSKSLEKVRACESQCKSIIEQLSEVRELQNQDEEIKMTSENSTPISNDETTSNHLINQIETKQEELDWCNSEIKDLKILSHLTPPQSHESSNPFLTSDRLLSEPTEIETCENSTPISNDETACNHHIKQIEKMQEELDWCNSEIKDLKILSHLTPPQSHESSNPFLTSDRLLSEPTEIEYFKNILYKYMMGTKTERLVKVMAAILEFTDEETKMVIEKAKTVPAFSENRA